MSWALNILIGIGLTVWCYILARVISRAIVRSLEERKKGIK